MGSDRAGSHAGQFAFRRLWIAGIALFGSNIIAACGFESLMWWLHLIQQPEWLIGHLIFAVAMSGAGVLTVVIASVRSWTERRLTSATLWAGVLLAIGFDLFVAQSPLSGVPPYLAPWLAVVEIQTLLVTTLALAWFLGQTWRSKPIHGRHPHT